MVQDTAKQSKPALWTPNFLLLCLSNISVCLAFHSLLPTLPMYIQSLGGGKETVGLALAALTVAAVIARPIAGWAADTMGRRLIMLAGLFLFLLPTTGLLFMVPLLPLLLLRIFQGVGWGVSTTALGTVAADIVPKNRLGEGLGYVGSTSSLSLAIAPALGLWLIESSSFELLFWLCTGFSLASIVFALPIRCPAHTPAPRSGSLSLVEKSAIKPSLVILLVALTYSSLLSFLALHVHQQGLASSGLFFSAMALSTLGIRPLAGMVLDRYGSQGYNLIVFSGFICLILGMYGIAGITTITGLLISGILYGIGFGFLQPSMLTLALLSAPARRGAANATYWTAFDIGVAAGSVLWGFVAQSWGYAGMFEANILALLAAAALYLVIVKEGLLPSVK